jgi:hypothetical protein
MMKKLLVAAATLAAAVMLPMAAMAAEGGNTIVDGTVTNSGSPVNGANVTVTCNGHTQTATTNSLGAYLVVFSAADCPVAATANVSAAKSGAGSGSNSGPVGPTDSAAINVGIVNVAIPEFGIVAGLLALLGAAGAFVVTRRHHLHQS